MAKTIEEILKELDEWVGENPERSVILIAGNEEANVIIKQRGMEAEILICVMSAIESDSKVEKIITDSMDVVKKYRRDKQKTENN